MLWGATDVDLADPPYVFRTVTMPQPANEKVAEDVVAKTGIKSVAFGVMSDNSGILSQGEAFKAGMEKAGVTDAGTVKTLSTTTNFTSAAIDLIQKDSDGIVVAGTQSNAVGLIAALHDKGYKGQIITGETIRGTGVYKSQPDALAGVPFPVYFLADQPANEAAKSFVSAYTKKYGTAPDGYAAQGYNALYNPRHGSEGRREGHDARRPVQGPDEDVQPAGHHLRRRHLQERPAQRPSAVQIVSYTAPSGDIAAWTPTN